MNEYLVSVAAKKVVKKLVQLGMAWLMTLPLDQVGITIDEKLATAGVFALLEIARDALKLKTGWTFL